MSSRFEIVNWTMKNLRLNQLLGLSILLFLGLAQCKSDSGITTMDDGSIREVISKWDNGNEKIVHIKSETAGTYRELQFFETGEMGAWLDFVNGKKHGTEERHNRDGSLSILRHYEKGELHGNFRECDGTGQPISQGNYTQGKLNGPFQAFYPNGQISIRGNYNMEKKSGTWEHFTETGTLTKRSNYVEDKKHGQEVYWENGKVIKTTNYNNGKEAALIRERSYGGGSSYCYPGNGNCAPDESDM